MQGIEPKLHTSLTSKIENYRLLVEALEDPESRSSDIAVQISELRNLYEDYLSSKKNLEQSIKNYKEYHENLRKRLTVRYRELKRKARQK
ncbi:hypothetical protein H3Z85_16810 [Chryseobacterium indologenes]|uniref:Uncharacterized protein n=1 Tax=Chryseobacterium indologenes TaxID=253 RepID=A0A1Z3VZ16_CHRID|nr:MULTISPECIES: hypothetical protein [Chryseobacterium]ASE60772.1 hypothetical protein CEQ15_04310 [Chryseobacterium indologenes]ATN04861.1 hypothetical protein CRN76_05325 [Chryseobacterium indologenes]AYY86387.1 hypothetical protein EGX91_18430 [Chryseobacterium indologenes]AYZ36289.1 hypothetical protein EGY07_12210 [Chryseobacterium indologenes]AZB16471.1 hypothetical protein EG352_01095 [Chryseobacterium indologenes]